MMGWALVGAAEVLFSLLGGVPVMNTLWIGLWVAVGACVLYASLIWMALWLKSPWFQIVTLLVVSLQMMMIIGPPIIQMQMLRDCETVEITVDTDKVKGNVSQVEQCRVKDNYYGEYGDWTVSLGRTVTTDKTNP